MDHANVGMAGRAPENEKVMPLAQPIDRTSGRAARVPAEPANPSREKAFRVAQSHSRKVRLLKITLPILAILMAAAFFGYSWILSPPGIDVQLEGAAFADGKLVMANPKLDGLSNGDRPYTMTAARAVQELDNQGMIELEQINAKLPVAKTDWAVVKAERGRYDRSKNTLEMTNDITVTTSDGMVARLNSALVDIDKGNLQTSDPVDIERPGTRIRSDSMTILQNGKVLVFEKRVRMHIDPGQVKAAAQTTGDTHAQ